MQKGFLVFIVLSFTSCNYLDAKKVAPEDILNEELKTFNWNEVDAYPTFSFCDEAIDKQAKKDCFETSLSNFITSHLETENIVVSQDINDTIVMEFQISETGELILKTIKVDSITTVEIPDIKILLANSLLVLPEIKPALKRAKPVKTEFTLPIEIIMN